MFNRYIFEGEIRQVSSQLTEGKGFGNWKIGVKPEI